MLDLSKSTAFRAGLRDGLPICLGYLSVSFTYGMRTVEDGLPFWFALLVSMSNLTSAGQFAGTALIAAGGSYLEVAITTFVINIRYMLMSLSLSQKADPAITLPQRAILSFGVTDEIFAVSMQQKGTIGAPYLAGLILTPYFGWAFGTLLGGTATGLLPFAARSALGIAIYGMFLAIIIPASADSKPVLRTVLFAGCLSCLLRWLPALSRLSGGWSIIICTIAAASYAALRFPITPVEADGEEEPS